MRKYYIDNIRWMTVALVLIYHICYLFNGVGVLGAVGTERNIVAFDGFLYAVYPWFMFLLFVVGGMCSRYSLEHRTHKQFMKERVTKLLIPSLLGIFVYHWIGGYINLMLGGAMEKIHVFIRYPIAALSGTGPLWFIQTLFLYSAILVLFRLIDKKDWLYNKCKKVNLPILILLGVFVYLGAQILNMPVISVFRFGIYGVGFFLGYFVLSHDEVQERLAFVKLPLLLIALGLGVIYIYINFGHNYADNASLCKPLTNLFTWFATLAVIGCFKAWLNRTNRFFTFMSKESFGMYIVHYPIAMCICYLLYYCTDLPHIANYLIALVVEVFGSILLFEIFKRIPIIRFWVLGIRKKKA